MNKSRSGLLKAFCGSLRDQDTPLLWLGAGNGSIVAETEPTCSNLILGGILMDDKGSKDPKRNDTIETIKEGKDDGGTKKK